MIKDENILKTIAYVRLLEEEVDIYQESIRDLVDILKPMKNDAPDFIVDWLEKNTEEIKTLLLKYEKLLKNKERH